MTTPARHRFDGELLTVPEIMKRLPGISSKAIRRHLARGHNTAALVRTHFNVQPKPKLHLHYGSRAPHCMGGPPPVPPTPVR